MHRLTRRVRFSINPFLSQQTEGSNSFSSKPTGEGLAIYFELSIELVDNVDPATGFIVNVSDIDKIVRNYALPVFINSVQKYYQQAKHVSLLTITELLKSSYGLLKNKFGTAKISNLTLNLNPFRKVTLKSEDTVMIYFSEKFEFAATHKLWNENFTKEKNLEIFGKCANPTSHGHNYIIEVTIKMPADRSGFKYDDFEKTVDTELIKKVDHKNLNLDVEWFRKTNPTVENITTFAWEKLVGKFGNQLLHCVTVWESDRTYCSYYG